MQTCATAFPSFRCLRPFSLLQYNRVQLFCKHKIMRVQSDGLKKSQQECEEENASTSKESRAAKQQKNENACSTMHGAPDEQDHKAASEAVFPLATCVLAVWLDVCVAARPLLLLLAHDPVAPRVLQDRDRGEVSPASLMSPIIMAAGTSLHNNIIGEVKVLVTSTAQQPSLRGGDD